MELHTKIKTDNSQILELLEKIRTSKGRRLNKLGELLKKREASPFVFDEKDLKYILK